MCFRAVGRCSSSSSCCSCSSTSTSRTRHSSSPPSCRPDPTTRKRYRRGEHCRDRRAQQPYRATVLRSRLAAADRHLVARRPDVADDVRDVRTAE